MARLVVPALCYHCLGAKVVYTNAYGVYRRSEFRPAEYVQLRAANLLAEGQCPICVGRGTVEVVVRD